MSEVVGYYYSGSAHISHWYGINERDRFVCQCGWAGTFKEMNNGFFAELIDGTCPTCDTMLAIRSLPTRDEIRTAAEAGIPEAMEQWRQIQASAPAEEASSDRATASEACH